MKEKINSFMKKIDSVQIYILIISAPLLNLTVEILTRRSLALTFTYILKSPHLFLLNSLIVMLTLVLAYFLPRRSFFMFFIFLTWLGLAIANFFLISYRSVPIAPTDFINLIRMFAIIKIYLSTFQIVLCLTVIVAIMAFLVYVWRLSPKESFILKRTVSCLLSFVLIFSVVLFIPLNTAALPHNTLNLAEAYETYGFVYCFINGFMDYGINEPDNYSKAAAEKIFYTVNGDKTNSPDELPNIIFIQLESFFDAKRIKELELSDEPTPFFNKLKELYPSGYLAVPTIGTGTANTEFEIITGMDIDYFGMGEYPYNTVVSKQTCESLAYNLAELGYFATAIHNYSATFYSRNEIFANLGFDNFISMEYMTDYEKNPLGWAKDAVLKNEILNTLTATGESDFVYTISVQGHGRYPSENFEYERHVTVNGFTDNSLIVKYEYFINQMYECDLFIKELVESLEAINEKTVVVFFGDHLPSLNITQEQLETGSRYDTEYVIWSNFEIEAEDKNLEAYELAAHTLGILGINNGLLTKLHQSELSIEERYKALHILQYDMLYGEKYVYDEKDYYIPTSLKMGREEIKIIKTEEAGGTLYIYGTGFTKNSVVYINSSKFETYYINKTTLAVKPKKNKNANYIYIAQISEADSSVLSRTENFIP